MRPPDGTSISQQLKNFFKNGLQKALLDAFRIWLRSKGLTSLFGVCLASLAHVAVGDAKARGLMWFGRILGKLGYTTLEDSMYALAQLYGGESWIQYLVWTVGLLATGYLIRLNIITSNRKEVHNSQFNVISVHKGGHLHMHFPVLEWPKAIGRRNSKPTNLTGDNVPLAEILTTDTEHRFSISVDGEDHELRFKTSWFKNRLFLDDSEVMIKTNIFRYQPHYEKVIKINGKRFKIEFEVEFNYWMAIIENIDINVYTIRD